MKSFSNEISELNQGSFLPQATVFEMVAALACGDFEESQISSWLLGMNELPKDSPRMGEFLGDLALALRGHSKEVVSLEGEWADCCGTGGGAASFNVSTAAAILASSCGVRVAKHGNRGVTSKCGSADILEAFGVDVQKFDIQKASKIGLGFLFAPTLHPIFARLAPYRRELGVRTLFNVMGPLLNPLRPAFQVIGVYDRSFMQAIAAASMKLGNEATLVVHGKLGEDEISAAGTSHGILARGSDLKEIQIHPADFGFDCLLKLPSAPDSIENSMLAFELALTNPESSEWRMAAMTAAALIWIHNPAQDKLGIGNKLKEITEMGMPMRQLEKLKA